MSNLTRYNLCVTEVFDDKVVGYFPADDGDFVKFDDIKELLNTAHNMQRLAEAAQINHALKSLESNDKRLEFLSDCFAGICRHCGEVTESCYCMRDD